MPDSLPDRSRPSRRAGALASSIAVLGWVALYAPDPLAAERKATPAQKEAELKQIRSRIERVRKSVNDDVEARDRLSVKLRDAELSVQQARKDLDDVRARRLQSEAQLSELEDERAEREAQLAVERDALSGELRTAYVNGHEEQLKLLLNQQDPAQVGRMLTYYGYFGRARAERIGAIREQLTELAALRQKIVAETERLEALEGEQTQQLDALRNAQKARAHAVAAVEGQIKTRSGELRRLESQAGSLEKLITQLAQGARVGPGREAGTVRAVARQAAMARAAGTRAGALWTTARGLARSSGRECSSAPIAVRECARHLPAVSSTPTGYRAWV
jgi:septal ring factor EnvC (AmiA/AmiB activator)